MIVGQGTHQYEWNENWAKLPASITLGYTHGVVVDRADNVYIFNQSAEALLVLDRQGQFVRSFGKQFAAGAHGLYLSRQPDGAEYLFLIDYELRQVVKTTLDGQTVLSLDPPPRKDLYTSAELYKPTDVCVAPNGDIYVFDGYGLPYVHRYDQNGQYLNSFGGPGAGPGQLNCPHGGWIDTRRDQAELYVADRGNNRIQVFSLDGRHRRFITAGQQQPCCFYQWQDELYIPDLLARVTVLDKNDQVVAQLGDNPQAPKTSGWPNIQPQLKTGMFNSPHALCVDSHGDVYVVEWISSGRITKLVRQR